MTPILEGAKRAMKPSILVVDDETAFLHSMRFSLRSQGYMDVVTIADPLQVSALLGQRSFDLAFLDINMPGCNGLDLLVQIKEKSPSTECMMLTANDEIAQVIRAIKAGAYDYLIKPLEPSQLFHSMERALEHRHLLRALRLRDPQASVEGLDEPACFEEIVTCDERFLRLLREAELHARSDIPILITGETGVGKELLAQAIHKASARRKAPFLAVNLLALSPTLFESAFFGAAKGAFTGSIEAMAGYLDQAQGGTLFLDEIGDLSLEIQGKLLRVLQEREYTPLGKTKPQKADLRFVAATNRDLEEAVQAGRFRRDLYYRLRFAHLHISPLRERKDDILLLAHTFLQRTSQGMPREISEEARRALLRFDWPGNIRELQGVIEAASNLASGEIALAHLPPMLRTEEKAAVDSSHPHALLMEPLAEIERKHILAVYQALQQNKTQTAKILGIALPTLHRKLKAYNVA
jgi:two-component system response regulator AtoC